MSRKAARSAAAAAAYRSGELVHDHTSGQIFDYTRKRGVEHSEIVLSTEAAQQDITGREIARRGGTRRSVRESTEFSRCARV